MINEIYHLFKKNLPYIERSEETVKRILEDKKNQIITHRNDEGLVGVSVINDNTIYLLCVDKAFQNMGIGDSLLLQSENYIISKGFKKIVLGTGKEYIMPGVPMNDGAHMFFKKRGYIHSWGDTGCLSFWARDRNNNRFRCATISYRQIMEKCGFIERKIKSKGFL